MVTNSKNTLFKKLICATLVLSFGGQSIATIDKPENTEPKSWSERYTTFSERCCAKGIKICKQIGTQIGNHIYKYRYAYGTGLFTIAAIATSKEINKRATFGKRLEMLKHLGVSNPEKMAKTMSEEKIKNLDELLKYGYPLEFAKELNKGHSPEIICSILEWLKMDTHPPLTEAVTVAYRKQKDSSRFRTVLFYVKSALGLGVFGSGFGIDADLY